MYPVNGIAAVSRTVMISKYVFHSVIVQSIHLCARVWTLFCCHAASTHPTRPQDLRAERILRTIAPRVMSAPRGNPAFIYLNNAIEFLHGILIQTTKNNVLSQLSFMCPRPCAILADQPIKPSNTGFRDTTSCPYPFWIR